MYMRIGKVTNIYPTTGKVKVMYEDERCASLPLSMLTMNNEYSMPAVGEKVVTVHMANGSSKGFVLGTYYGGGTQPKANAGYRKDFGGGAYAICEGGEYLLYANKATLKALAGVVIEAESGPVEIKSTASDASIALDTNTVIKATNVTVEADEVTLKCSYGEITVEELMKRLERIEDQLGLPHTID